VREEIVNSWGLISQNKLTKVAYFDRTKSPFHLWPISPSGIAYGQGRSYGDVCLNTEGLVCKTEGLDRFINFDEQAGVLECEAGTLIRDIQESFVSRGWMLRVTPGTQFVTVGGAIANDIHGKNHQKEGSFGCSVDSITLARSDGTTLTCSPRQNRGMFLSTIGGMGLTGLILSAKIRLKPVPGPWVSVERLPFRNYEEFLSLSLASDTLWEYTVSWIDLLSGKDLRGILFRANHISFNKKLKNRSTISFPFTPKNSLLGERRIKMLNAIYFSYNVKARTRFIQDYKSYFYPLDGILRWNHLYGRKGFYQYQSVIPFESTPAFLKSCKVLIQKYKKGSFLSVLKTFGKTPSRGHLSFARPGVTFAMDFPNDGPETDLILTYLYDLTLDVGGAIYPAKDARMSAKMFEMTYPNLTSFLNFRDPWFSSNMSRRILGD